MVNANDHIQLVKKVVNKFNYDRRIPIEDTEEFADGMVGLTCACNEYDPKTGNAFSTFAYHCIRNAICVGLRNRKKEQYLHFLENFEAFWNEEPEEGWEEIIPMILDAYPMRDEDDAINKMIIMQHFFKGVPYVDLAKRLGLSKERIRQRKDQALRVLANIIYNKFPRDFVTVN
jgi:RNA polymerase sigma factor (sigma-70 family)